MRSKRKYYNKYKPQDYQEYDVQPSWWQKVLLFLVAMGIGGSLATIFFTL
jgi:hypothetical protein